MAAVMSSHSAFVRGAPVCPVRARGRRAVNAHSRGGLKVMAEGTGRFIVGEFE
jgi:hypothetical protein